MSVKTMTPFRINAQVSLTQPVELDIPPVTQDQENWCWAACNQMVARFYNHVDLDQCAIVGRIHGPDCCAAPTGGNCGDGCNPGDVRIVYQTDNISCQLIVGPVPFGQIQDEIAGGRPVEIGYRTEGVSGHVILVRGTRSDPNGNFLLVNDPLNTKGSIRYESLLTTHNMKWVCTWINITQP